MTILIVGVLYGLLFAYFATQNIFPITIRLGNLVFDNVPVYMVALGSLLLGVLVSWIISLLDSLYTGFNLYRKDSAIRESSRTMEELQERIHELEVENAGLRSETGRNYNETEEYREKPRRSLFERIRHNLSA